MDQAAQSLGIFKNGKVKEIQQGLVEKTMEATRRIAALGREM